MIKKISGQERVKNILAIDAKATKVLSNLGITLKDDDRDLALIELALKNKIPLQILLNNLAKGLNLEVEWPKVSGVDEKFIGAYGKSAGSRTGRPVHIKKFVAVHSGKGGVGKTFIAIALALYGLGQKKKIGLLDLDIDCPNIYKALSLKGRLIANKNRQIEPLNYRGLKVISMGAVLERENEAIMWRGPILTKAIEQLLYDTAWGELDLLVIDFPPGTGDAPLTLFNMLKPDMVVAVSTATPIALLDTSKTIDMCKQLGVKVAGLVINMAGEVFGKLSEKKAKEKLGVELLASIKISKNYGSSLDWTRQPDALLKPKIKSVWKKIFS